MEAHLVDIGKSNEGIDALEKVMLNELPPALEKLTHTFTPGLYSRTWEADAGTIWVSRIHRTRHQFVILEGFLSVWVDGKETVYEAPFHGITEPGTRRILYIHEKTKWITFHANPNELKEDEIVELITEPHNNSLFSEEDEMRLKEIRNCISKQYLTQ